jgi:hypothetical protein
MTASFPAVRDSRSPDAPCKDQSVHRSAYRACVVVLVLSFVVTACTLLQVMAVKHNTCLSQTQADRLGGLSTSGIPAQCAAQFHQHVEMSLVVAGLFSVFISSAFAMWTPSRRRRSVQSA